jgi:hypothetical protein
MRNSPDFFVEVDFEANALAVRSHNPGIKPEVMLELARRVLRETRGFGKDQQTLELEYLARKHLRISKADTEVIVNASRGKTISMLDMEPAERPVQSQQFRPDEDEDPRPAA